MIERIAEKEIDRDPINYIRAESVIDENKIKVMSNTNLLNLSSDNLEISDYRNTIGGAQTKGLNEY